MSHYHIRDVLSLIGVKKHVLRYWEQRVPLVRAQRNASGHRVWTKAQVRLLLRLRYLIVEKGVSVQAAGTSLIQDTAVNPTIAHVKDHLTRTLLALKRTNTASHALYKQPHDFPMLSDKKYLDMDTVIDGGYVSVPRTDYIRVYRKSPHVSFVTNTAVSSGSNEYSTDALLIYSHLFVREDPEIVAKTLYLLIEHRLQRSLAAQTDAREDTRPCLIITVLHEEQAIYQNVFGNSAYLLPIQLLCWRGNSWLAPTTTAIEALISHRELKAFFTQAGIRNVLAWLPDDPNSLPTAADVTAQAMRSKYGVSCGVHKNGDGKLMVSCACFYLPQWQKHYAEFFSCGSWRYITFDLRFHIAETEKEGWCFEIWLRDLLHLDAQAVLLPNTDSQMVWYTGSWTEQMQHVFGIRLE